VSPAFTPDCDDLHRLYCRDHPLILGHGAGAEVRGVTGITVFSGMLGVTLFGLFLTPVFYVTLRKFVTRDKPAEDVSPA
jgi:multidrug efflux pump